MKLKIKKEQIHPEVRNVPLLTKIIDWFPPTKLGFRIYNNGAAEIRLRIYKTENATTRLPVMLYLHGGGYALGIPEHSADVFLNAL